MKFIVDSNVIISKGLSMLEFSIVLYYLWGGKGVIHDDICNNLWNKGYLIKVTDGFSIDNNKFSEIENITTISGMSLSDKNTILELADAMRVLFPSGKKPGTNYYWRDSSEIIAQRLSLFFKKYGNNYSSNQIINATKKYVESFNGDYRFMQLLKYFINKQNRQTGEVTSELASYLSNEGQEDELSNDWTSNLV